jgi:hypothetical protein
MDLWYECTECIYASNSRKLADRHEDEKGHTVVATADVVDPPQD